MFYLKVQGPTLLIGTDTMMKRVYAGLPYIEFTFFKMRTMYARIARQKRVMVYSCVYLRRE